MRDVLTFAVQEDDRAIRFYAHYGLWKAYQALGDGERAISEARAAKDHLKFGDEKTPETREVREQPSATVAEVAPKRRRKAS